MIVVDASVALKWVFDEEYADEAMALQEGPDVPIAPVLMLSEAGNALWKRVRRGEMQPDEAATMFDGLKAIPVGYVYEEHLVEPALRLAMTLDHPIYDCLYLALAIRENTLLATADVRFARLLIRHGHGDRLHLIGEMK